MQFNKYYLILCLVFSSVIGKGQDIVVEWEGGQPQSLVDNEFADIKVEWPKFPISAVRVGAEVVGPVTSVLVSDFSSFEIDAEVLFKNRYFITLDYGTSNVTRGDLDTELTIFPGDIQNPEQASYTSKGSFFRIGADYNFLHKASTNDAVTMGVRLAQSNFDQSATIFTQGSDFWEIPAGLKTYEDNDLRVRWFEIVVGYKVMIINNLFLGANLRFAMLFDEPSDTNVSLNDIPGIGFYDGEGSKINVNGYISYRISIGKPKVTYTEKK